MEFNILYGICMLLFWSWQYAKERGVPWFSWGGRQSRTKKMPVTKTQAQPHVMRNRHRTGNRKPQSPWTQKQAVPKKQAQPSHQSPPKQPNAYPAAAFARLNALTHDPAATERLIARLREKNPHRNVAWCIDKAIYDIERDRMAR